MKRFSIKIPASTANLGPGFDVLGIALSLYLKVNVSIPAADNKLGIHITCEGEGQDELSCIPTKNLITKTAIYTANACNTELPSSMSIHCINDIPLGGGLGSSGSAVVAGVVLANIACNLNLSKNRLLDYCLYIEGHPDNVAPSLLGGFVTAYMRSSFLDGAVSSDHSSSIKNYPSDEPVGKFVKLPISPKIKVIAITPDFQLPTIKARECVPTTYSRSDVIFNLQRVAVLVSALGQSDPDPSIISEAMQDKMHQQYRQHLIPGLPEILKLTPDTVDGLLGICLSGAGPTVLVLAKDHTNDICLKIQNIFSSHSGNDGKPIQSLVRFLDIELNGFNVELNQ